MEHKHPLGVINTYRLTVILSNYPIQLSTGNELTWSRSRLWTLTLTVLLASFILSNSIVLKVQFTQMRLSSLIFKTIYPHKVFLKKKKLFNCYEV